MKQTYRSLSDVVSLLWHTYPLEEDLQKLTFLAEDLVDSVGLPASHADLTAALNDFNYAQS